ncbi:DedA family protein [Corynebacterium choanae]|uniref:Inner membrane protein YqjA n=1 Tax=Corynebacterium choanae TaxID=1862358 RepID=A0A3G6J6F7_9CORY|nr:DedA family protein [Corynebacterium choanae]AZA13536.1 Inner membrane protein YqjA [Corynebacterium choanae]
MFDVDTLLTSFGLLGICAIIFMETGVLIGFIFPGDTLLFTAGIMAHNEPPIAPLWALLVVIPAAAAAGDQVGYLLGRRVGRRILSAKAVGWMGPDAVQRTNEFFARYGPVTVLFARFVGVVRTLTPLTAGIAHMNHRLFTVYSIIGSILWGAGFVLLGYMVGEIPIVQEFLHVFILAGMLTVLLPLGLKLGAATYRYMLVKKKAATKKTREYQRRHIDRHSAHPRSAAARQRAVSAADKAAHSSPRQDT